MEGGNSEENVALPTLPDDIFFHMAENHLSPKDCMALALSGAMNESYASLHGSNRICNISRCTFLGVSRWTEFFRQHINPPTITVFNVNHLYWFPPDVLVDNIVLLENLEDLNVLDTQVSLSHLPRVFVNCQKITRLGLSLAGLLTLEDFQGNTIGNGVPLYCMKNCFKRLTQLSIFNFEKNSCGDPNDPYGDKLDGWPVTYGVLSWCRDCVHLKIDVSCQDIHTRFSSTPIRRFCREFSPFLGWMNKLESLIIRRRACHKGMGNDPYVTNILDWMFERKADTLRRIWVDASSMLESPYREKLGAPSVTSFYVGDASVWEPMYPVDLNDKQYCGIHHLGGLILNSSLVELPNLKYASFSCKDFKVLDPFCESHPLLQSLHFTIRGYLDEEEEKEEEEDDVLLIKPGNWKLMKLKDLVYHCRRPDKEVVNHLIEACPNIVSLYVGDKESFGIACCNSAWSTDTVLQEKMSTNRVDFLSAISFHRLTSLSIVCLSLSDGSYLPSILKQCPLLESLNLSGECVPDSFLLNVGQCLPNATNLRDLRLEWTGNERVSSVLLFLKNLLNCAGHLERLVVYNAQGLCTFADKSWECPSDIEDVLVNFAFKMDHLVALCLAGFLIHPKIIRDMYRRVKKEILPLRPSFWFYLARRRPVENDCSIPRVHYDEVVNPIDGFYAPPLSF